MNFNQNAEHPSVSAFDYLSRNEKWLRPAAGTLLAVAAPALVAGIDPKLAASFPAWIGPTASVLGCFCVGLGAVMTDTFSARLVRILGFGAGVGILLARIFA